MLPTGWKPCLIDIDRASEFTGDDVDRYSELIDLGMPCEFITVIIPTMVSAQITPYIQRDGNVASVPVPVHFWNDISADTDVVQSTVADTGGIAITFNIGGAQFFRLYSSANQTVDETFYIRGFNRG